MDSSKHLIVLQQAAEGSLPIRVDSDAVVNLGAVRDLVTGGFISATDVSTQDQAAFLNLAITSQGREHLRHLRELYPPTSFKDFFAGRLPLWLRMLGSALVAIIIWYVAMALFGAGGIGT